MRGHVGEEQWIDVVDGVADPQVRRHLEACAECRATADAMRASVALVREADVPEPSPLYWETFRARVGEAIAEEKAPPSRWRLVPRWAIAAASLAVLSTAFHAPRREVNVPAAPVVVEAWSPLPEAQDDEALPVLAAAASGGEVACADVASCAIDLSAIEPEGLAEALNPNGELAS